MFPKPSIVAIVFEFMIEVLAALLF